MKPDSNTSIILSITILFSFFSAFSQRVDLSTNWQFAIGEIADKPEWKTMPKTSFIEEQGYPEYKGKAFLKKSILIPASHKPLVDKYGYASLVLGYLDDCDKTFFNGKPVGSEGTLPPNYSSAYNIFRNYRIPKDLILWDKENEILIELYDDLGNGGFSHEFFPFIQIPSDTMFEISEQTDSIISVKKKISIEPNLKEKAFLEGGLYLNHQFSGKVSLLFNQSYKSKSVNSRAHKHFIPFSSINWDSANELKLSIDKVTGKKEMFMQKPFFTLPDASDKLNIRLIESKQTKGSAEIKILASNQSPKNLKGNLKILVYRDEAIEAHSVEKNIELASNANVEYGFKLPINHKGKYTIAYCFTEQGANKVIVGSVAKGIN